MKTPRVESWPRVVRRVALAVALIVLALIGARLGNLWYLGRIGFYAGEWSEHEADPSAGFDWPYRVYVPESVAASDGPLRIWVRPNNTSAGANDDFEVHHEDAKHLLEVSRWEAEELGVVVLVPSFPRPGSDSDLWGTLVLDVETLRRERPMGQLDLQLLAMIDALSEGLRGRGRSVCDRVLIDGFSASAMFTSRFVMIHPERVEAAAIGAPGGWPMVPVAADEGATLAYPAGTADYAARFGRAFPAEAVREIPLWFYLGAHDENDAVPYRDSFPEDVAEQIWMRFGEAPVERWDDAKRLFAGYDAEFHLYPDLGHEAPKAVRRDVIAFFADHDDRSACAR